jgi:hypothetical protein
MTDDLSRAIDVVLDTLGPVALDEYLTYLPDRCSFCGFHPPTQGHADGCLDGPRGDSSVYPVLFAGSDICRDWANPTGKTASAPAVFGGIGVGKTAPASAAPAPLTASRHGSWTTAPSTRRV